MLDLQGAGLFAVFILGPSVLFAHARICLRFASALSRSDTLALTWCLLSLGSWILFTAAAVGVFVLGFHLTEMWETNDLPNILFAMLMLSAIPYHLLLAVLGASVMKRVGGSRRAGLTIVLMLVLSIPVMMVGTEVTMLLPGIEIMD